MSAFDGVLGARKLRRIARATGLEAVRGWAYGYSHWEFVTSDHQHYEIDPGLTSWERIEPRWHYSSCPATPEEAP